MTRRLIAAALLTAVIFAGAFTVLHAAYPPGRCACETMGYGVWDWEYWAYDCWTPRPPECDPL